MEAPPDDVPSAAPPRPDGPPRDVRAAPAPKGFTTPGGSRSKKPQSSFSPGERLAGRFKILRFIAQGGSGEIYEAEDQELRVRVALKVVRPEMADNEQAIERFRREIQFARLITHPNVCRIFEIFSHGHPPHNILFFTMELLRGESLAARVRRLGPMSPEEALPVVRQMVAGLHAAHKAGVIHRDFKSANVVLVPDGDEIRAVITDFGLARCEPQLPENPYEHSLTYEGTVVGTPSYMSPEQLTGGEITPLVDTYALGIVLYEMMTGQRPFKGESDLSTAVKRLTEPPPSPRLHTPDLDPRWEKVILRCLEREPTDRFQRLQEIVEALESGGVAAKPTQPAKRGGLSRAVVLTGVAGVALTAGFFASKLTSEESIPFPLQVVAPPSFASTTATDPTSVAVLTLRNLSGKPEAAWLSAALAEMIEMELAAGGQVDMVPNERIAQLGEELELTSASSLARETIDEIRDELASDVVIEGSYLALGPDSDGPIRLHLRVHENARTTPLTVPGQQSELFDLMARTGSSLREVLGLSGEAYTWKVSVTQDPEAKRLFQDGLEKIQLLEGRAALETLDKAIELDPIHALAHGALAESWSLLGYDAEAQKAAKRALELSDPLSREHKLALEARYHEVKGDWREAAETYASLFRFFPNNVEYGLHLALALASTGRGEEALQILSELEDTEDDPRILLAEARAARTLGRHEQQRQAAQKALQTALTRNWDAIAAESRLRESEALLELGRLAAARTSASAAQRRFTELGVQRGVAQSLGLLSLIHRREGDRDGAAKLAQQARQIFADLGTRDNWPLQGS